MTAPPSDDPKTGRTSVTVFERGPEQYELNEVKRSRLGFALAAILLAGMVAASGFALFFIWQSKNVEISRLEARHKSALQNMDRRVQELQTTNRDISQQLKETSQELALLKERYSDSERLRNRFASVEAEILSYLQVLPERKSLEFEGRLQSLTRPAEIERTSVQATVRDIEKLRDAIKSWAETNTITLPQEPF